MYLGLGDILKENEDQPRLKHFNLNMILTCNIYIENFIIFQYNYYTVTAQVGQKIIFAEVSHTAPLSILIS